jgi:hypothetical protein
MYHDALHPSPNTIINKTPPFVVPLLTASLTQDELCAVSLISHTNIKR